MRSNHKRRCSLIIGAAVLSTMAFNTAVSAATYQKSITGWENSMYEIPDGAAQSSAGIEIIESGAWAGSGAVHLWSGGTKGSGYISRMATVISGLEAGKTYRLTGMIKTTKVTWGYGALTLGDVNKSTNIANGLTAGEWGSFSVDFEYKSGESKELRIQLWNSGDIWLDNLSLKEVTDTGVGAELLSNGDFEKDFITVYTVPQVIKDDDENIIVGATEEMEYSLNGGESWTAFDKDNMPDLSGNKTVLIRYAEDPDKKINTLRLSFTTNKAANGDFTLSELAVEKNSLNISGSLKGAKADNVNILLVREGSSKRSLDDILVAGSFTTDANGDFKFTSPLADKRNGMKNDGNYTLYLKSDDTEIHSLGSVYFASSDSRTEAVEMLKSGDVGKYFEEDNEYYKVFDAIGFALDDYAKLGANKTTAISIFESKVGELSEGLNEDNACEAFAKAVVLAATGSGDEKLVSELLKKYGSLFDFKYGDDVTLDKVMGDEGTMGFISAYLAANRAGTEADARKLFNEAYALYLVNNSTYGVIGSQIKAQKDYLSLSGYYYDRYMSLLQSGSDAAVSISKYLVEQCAASPFKSAARLSEAIENGVKIYAPEESGGSSGGGGGGGFSGGGASAPVAVPTVKDVEYFDDLADCVWAREAVNTLFEKGIVSGRGSGVFAPQDNVTRQEFVKMIVDLTGSYSETAQCEFDDVDKNAWYYKYVASAVSSGLIYGVSDEEFGTDMLITREQMAVIADRIFNKKSDTEAEAYADDNDISAYARESVYNVKALGIIGGYEDNTFRPQKSATRAEAAVICFNILKKR